jgi:hypothetical protein
MHVWRRDRDLVLASLSRALSAAGYEVTSKLISPPHANAKGDELLFLIPPQSGEWTTVVQTHDDSEEPNLADLAKAVSLDLNTYSIALKIHDDDVFFYNLYHAGHDVDGYNSSPLHFERQVLPENAIESQRHAPSCFGPILPRGVKLEQLRSILDRGWWAAHDAGRLDVSGGLMERESTFPSEEHRMVALGNLLQLHGRSTGYPYAAWNNSPHIDWTNIIAVLAMKG